jgi:ribosomal protein L3 glutamine methyltransferase
VVHRLPAAYLLHEAWLGEFRFYVDQRVIVPRSYFAELLEDGFAPWIEDPEAVESALDLCTGSGCLAILMAHAFPNAAVDAIDISPDALVVAAATSPTTASKIACMPVESDLFAAVRASATTSSSATRPTSRRRHGRLPAEYRHEPALALAAGPDGLDVVRRILARRASTSIRGGVIAIEVGHNQDLVTAAFPDLPAVWLDTEHAEGKVPREPIPADARRPAFSSREFNQDASKAKKAAKSGPVVITDRTGG